MIISNTNNSKVTNPNNKLINSQNECERSCRSDCSEKLCLDTCTRQCDCGCGSPSPALASIRAASLSSSASEAESKNERAPLSRNSFCFNESKRIHLVWIHEQIREVGRH